MSNRQAKNARQRRWLARDAAGVKMVTIPVDLDLVEFLIETDRLHRDESEDRGQIKLIKLLF